jgi:hypothetical protein
MAKTKLDMRAKSVVTKAILDVLKTKLLTGFHPTKVILASLKETYGADVRHHIMNRALAALRFKRKIDIGYMFETDVQSPELAGRVLMFSLKTTTTNRSKGIKAQDLQESSARVERASLETSVVGEVPTRGMASSLAVDDADSSDGAGPATNLECSGTRQPVNEEECVIAALESLERRTGTCWHTVKEVEDELKTVRNGQCRNVGEVRTILAELAFGSFLIRGDQAGINYGTCRCSQRL